MQFLKYGLHSGFRIRMLYIVKKSFSISLVLLLLVSITGVSVNTHYCHGQARYTALATDAEHESCCGDAMDACPSCEDRVQSNVMDEQSTVAMQPEFDIEILPLLLSPVTVQLSGEAEFVVLPQPVSHGPPGLSAGMSIPVFVQSFLN
jgi:hypothetical protein